MPLSHSIQAALTSERQDENTMRRASRNPFSLADRLSKAQLTNQERTATYMHVFHIYRSLYQL